MSEDKGPLSRMLEELGEEKFREVMEKMGSPLERTIIVEDEPEE